MTVDTSPGPAMGLLADIPLSFVLYILTCCTRVHIRFHAFSHLFFFFERIHYCPMFNLHRRLKRSPSLMLQDRFTHMSGTLFTFDRTLDSRSAFEPSGHVSGTAAFDTTHPHLSPSSSSSLGISSSDQVLLYIEEGVFTTSSGLQLHVHKRYCWVWTPESALLRVFFVKPGSDSSPDYLFLELSSSSSSAGVSSEEGEVRKDRHHCGSDVYDAEYRLEGLLKGEKEWSVRYDVHGPKKDYTSLTTYRRTRPPSNAR